MESVRKKGRAMQVFADRREAGQRLARKLASFHGRDDVVVLGLPRGGVPVAFEVARALGAPLDVIVVRKLGLPGQPEFAMGALGEGGFWYLDEGLLARARVSRSQVQGVLARERDVLERRLESLRSGRPPLDLSGKVAIVVDDGLATGATARVACRIARHLGAAEVILAVPVAPPEALDEMEGGPDGADRVVCVATPSPFYAVGQHYVDFAPVPDAEVVRLIDEAAARQPAHASAPVSGEVVIPVDGGAVIGDLQVPAEPCGTVVFAHGSGSSRHSPRNRYVAEVLQRAGFATLLLDLLTPAEEQDRANVFDIGLLASRLAQVVSWVHRQPVLQEVPVGLFGASTGAASALVAAADPQLRVQAVVSRGGRPDLAGGRLAEVTAPTLLVVGGADPMVLELNEAARARLRGPNRLAVVPGATHLFEEPGTLEQVALLARGWFQVHLGAQRSVAS
jgi:putative phosphoribosyl transferase